MSLSMLLSFGKSLAGGFYVESSFFSASFKLHSEVGMNAVTATYFYLPAMCVVTFIRSASVRRFYERPRCVTLWGIIRPTN